MNKHDDGGQAFPVQNGYEASTVQGMSLRDYFAAKAMAAMTEGSWPGGDDRPEIAKRAYAMADAMLKERSK